MKVIEFDTAGAIEDLGRGWNSWKDRLTLRLQLNLASGEFTMNFVDSYITGTSSTAMIDVILPLLHTQAGHALLHSLTPAAQRVLDGTTPNPVRGGLYQHDKDAKDAIEEILRAPASVKESADGDGDLLEVKIAEGALLPLLSADTTNFKIGKICTKIIDDLRSETRHTIVPGLREYVIFKRSELRKDRESTLEAIAAKIEENIALRNEAIQLMAAWRDEADRRVHSDRHIAKLAGISHTSVQNIRKAESRRARLYTSD